MRMGVLVVIASLLPAALAAQTPDSALARMTQRIDAIQAQLDSLRAEVRALSPAPSPAALSGAFTPHARTKTAHCLAHQALPDTACTPGAIMTNDMNVICHTTTQGRRDVTGAVERAAYGSYDVTYPQPVGSIELDHLISLELGGDNTVENLWPEFAEPKPGFHEKDLVENELHRRVCSGDLTLDAARQIITTDWKSYYLTHLQH